MTGRPIATSRGLRGDVEVFCGSGGWAHKVILGPSARSISSTSSVTSWSHIHRNPAHKGAGPVCGRDVLCVVWRGGADITDYVYTLGLPGVPDDFNEPNDES